MDRVDALIGFALTVGLLLVVLVEKTLTAAGLATLGLVVYPVGYGTLVLIAWYVWIRPLDLRAPDPADGAWETDDGGDTESPAAETE